MRRRTKRNSRTDPSLEIWKSRLVQDSAVLVQVDPFQVRPEVDSMASLLGKFDVDSQMGIADESTLKATGKVDPSDPTDFSKLTTQH